MPNYVPGEGPSCAKIMCVLEAPGRTEDELGRPCMGKAGQIYDTILRNCGISREEVYTTNVVKIRPPDNKLARLPELGKTVEDFLPTLWEEINTINPNIIIAFGATALRYITGQVGIHNYRGSILQSLHGFPKVIPTLHPAALMERKHEGLGALAWRQKVLIEFDVRRAIQQSQFPDYRLPKRNLHICSSSLDLYRFLQRYESYNKLYFDVETYKTIPLCLGICFNKSEAISIPLFNMLSESNPKGFTTYEQVEIFQMCARLMSSPIEKGAQNGKFDIRVLSSIGIQVKNYKHDTLLKFKCLYPELPGKLQVISSIQTEEPYYKDEGKEYNPKKDDISRLFLYNAKDSAVEFECDEAMDVELDELGLRQFYEEFIIPLHDFYYDLESEGILTNKEAQRELEDRYRRIEDDNQKGLAELAEKEINVNSPKQVAELLYKELRIPARFKKNTKGQQVVTTEDEALTGLMLNVLNKPNKEKERKIVERILYGRKVKKAISTYITARTGFGDWREIDDSRMYTSYFIAGAETGRTSTSKREPPESIGSYGLPFQTITKHGEFSDLRTIFIPDEDHYLVEVDGEQAESRVVALLGKDEKMLQLFENHRQATTVEDKIRYDIHRITASWIYNCSVFDITDEMRQLGKSMRHAGERGMGKETLSKKANISQWYSAKVLKIFHENNPNIEQVYFKEIVEECQANNMTLRSPHGRYRQFYDKWSDELFRQIYSHLPQCVVSDHNKLCALQIKKLLNYVRIVQESHDSFLSLIPKLFLRDFADSIRRIYETPIDFAKCTLKRGKLIIPCEIKYSDTNWKEMKKYDFNRVSTSH